MLLPLSLAAFSSPSTRGQAVTCPHFFTPNATVDHQRHILLEVTPRVEIDVRDRDVVAVIHSPLASKPLERWDLWRDIYTRRSSKL